MDDRNPTFEAIRAAIMQEEAKPTDEVYGMLDDSLRRQADDSLRREQDELMALGRELAETMKRSILITKRNTAALEANTAALAAAGGEHDPADDWRNGAGDT